MRPTPRSALAALGLAGLAVLAGCGGGDGGEGTTAPPATTAAPTTATTAPPAAAGPVVRVVDGDTNDPVPGARVRPAGGGPVVVSDADGAAELPPGTRFARVQAPGRQPQPVVRLRTGAPVEVEVFQPALQSPQYGGGAARTRYVPAVRVPPPGRRRPAWTFDGRTLVEFPPAVANGLVVFGTNSGRVFALDHDTGEVVWARRQRSYIASTPAIDGDQVIVTSMDGMATAYGAGAGLRRWQHSTGGSPIESSPLVVGDEVYFGAWNGELTSLDRRTGRVRWTFQADGDIKGSAALAGDLVVVGDYGGSVHGVRRSDGAEVWSTSAGARFYGGPGVSRDTVVIGDVGGAVVALDARTGAQRWRHSTGGAYVYSSPAIADGVVYIGSYNGQFQALDLDTGAVRWSFDAGGRISGSATVVDGVVYTAVLAAPGEPRRTWGLDARTGAVRYRGTDGRYSPAVAAGRTLYLVGTKLVSAYPAPER
ncbi:MAG: PQQ-binding-like beta-propeller repeat protein [Thermoleophilia bacterium]|nr:PQQ-binding-like beta-propeller repeat protein [Thermoleophilia bacterium]